MKQRACESRTVLLYAPTIKRSPQRNSLAVHKEAVKVGLYWHGNGSHLAEQQNGTLGRMLWLSTFLRLGDRLCHFLE